MRRVLLLLCALVTATAAYAWSPKLTGPNPFYWNFIKQAALPPNWTITRAACTGSVSSCVTNGQYNDPNAQGYTTYPANTAVFSGAGIGVFEARTNYLFPSDTPTTTTTGTVPLGYYVFMCNGSGSVLTAAVTGVASGLGTLSCSSSYQTVHVTTAGTFIFTPTGTVNWWDLQGSCGYANAACGPTPHIVTTSGTSARPADLIKLGTADAARMGVRNSSVLTEYYATSSGASNLILTLGGPASGDFALAPIDGSACESQLIASANLGTSGSNQALFTTNRIAATLNPGNYATSCNGTASTNSSNSTPSTAIANILGSGNSGNYCNCWISQIKIWPYVLPTTLLRQYSSLGAAF